MCIIGLADQYVYERIEMENYELQVEILKDEVAKYNVDVDSGHADSMGQCRITC
jgi:hypothetical protein